MSVGQPQTLKLQLFGDIVYEAFGEMPYHVGSSLEKKDGWRDVDIRLLLPDDVYEKFGLGDPEQPHENFLWVGLTLAFSALGNQMTGLPIDFQIQQLTYANKEFTGQRSAVFSYRKARKSYE